MTTTTGLPLFSILLTYFCIGILCLAIIGLFFYFIIKWAVRNGIKEAHRDIKRTEVTENSQVK